MNRESLAVSILTTQYSLLTTNSKFSSGFYKIWYDFGCVFLRIRILMYLFYETLIISKFATFGFCYRLF